MLSGRWEVGDKNLTLEWHDSNPKSCTEWKNCMFVSTFDEIRKDKVQNYLGSMVPP